MVLLWNKQWYHEKVMGYYHYHHHHYFLKIITMYYYQYHYWIAFLRHPKQMVEKSEHIQLYVLNHNWVNMVITDNQKVQWAAQTVNNTTILNRKTLTLVLLNQDRHCLWKLNEKQFGSWSDGFFRSHLIWIYTVSHSVYKFIWTNNIELSDWSTVRNGCDKLNLFSRIRVK